MIRQKTIQQTQGSQTQRQDISESLYDPWHCKHVLVDSRADLLSGFYTLKTALYLSIPVLRIIPLSSPRGERGHRGRVRREWKNMDGLELAASNLKVSWKSPEKYFLTLKKKFFQKLISKLNYFFCSITYLQVWKWNYKTKMPHTCADKSHKKNPAELFKTNETKNVTSHGSYAMDFILFYFYIYIYIYIINSLEISD